MNKKATAALAAFLLMLSFCAACEKEATSPYGRVITDERGMEHVVMTDASGETLVNKDGRMIEVMTDSDSKKPIPAQTENGTQQVEYETAGITFPGVQQEGRTFEDQFMTVRIPLGWEKVSSDKIVMRQKSTGVQMTVYADLNRSVDALLEEQSSQREEIKGVDFDYSRGEHEIDGYTATFERMVVGESVYYNYYVWTKHSQTHEISFVIPKDQEQKFDVDAVLKTVHFK